MTKKPAPAAAAPAPETAPAAAPPHALPSSGGSYTIDAQGNLIPDTAKPAPEAGV